MNLYEKTEHLLYTYKNMLAEIKNIDLEIANIDYIGCAPIGYTEKSSPTNAFTSAVESEVISREKRIKQLEDSKRDNVLIVSKINNALETLDSRAKDIIKMKYFDRINNRNIATRLNLTEVWICNLKTSAINNISSLINI